MLGETCVIAELAAFVRASERQQRHVPGPLDGYSQRSLMLGARAHLAPRFDLAALANVAAKPGKVLVVDMLNVVDREGGYLATRRVAAPASRSPSTGSRPATVAAFTFATAPGTTALTLRSAKARSSGPPFAVRPRRPIFSFLGIVRHGWCTFCSG